MRFINNSIRKVSLAMLLVAVCFLFLPSRAMAATTSPANVRKAVAVAGDRQATIKWTKVSDANGYIIQVLSGTKYVTAASINRGSTVSKTLTKLVNGKTYKFRVYAYRVVGKKKYYSKAASNIVSVTPKAPALAAPELKVAGNGNGTVSLYWYPVKNANGYELLQKNAEGKFVRIGVTTKKKSKYTCTVKKLTNGQEYQFVLRAFRKSGSKVSYGNMSEVITGKPFDSATALKSITGVQYTAKVKKACTVTTSTGEKLSLKKGKTVIVIKRSGTNNNVYTCYTDNKPERTFTLTKSYATLNNLYTNGSANPSTAQAEAFVNSKGYGSKTNYMIWVNIYSQHVYVFKGSRYNWKCVLHTKAATGLFRSQTKIGINQVYRKRMEASFDDDEVWWGKYVTWVQHGQAIHTWAYARYDGELKRPSIVKPHFGAPVSNGCVRVPDKYAIWIYNNVPMWSTTVVY